MSKIEELRAALAPIEVVTDEIILRGKSRDFYWYSPILKDRLAHVRAEAVVTPKNENEVLAILAACHRLDLPVTARGGGTGNYGQAMPLHGGVVMDMTAMNTIIEIADGQLVVEAGALMGDIEEQTLAHSNQELRMHPSTRETATIGGFIGGGSGGVGSIRWGMLRETGNILSLRVATMEAEPKLVDLSGPDLNLVHHSYGTNGIITRVEVPLVPAQKWVEMLVAFDDWMTCVKTGWIVAGHQGLWLKQCAAIQAPAPHRYFLRHRKFLEEGDNLLCILAAPNAVAPLVGELEKAGGRVAYRSDTCPAEERKGLPHLHHLTWNHTTLRALKTDREMTYLQLGLPQEGQFEAIATIAEKFEGEIINHLEYTRSGGRLYASQLPMMRYSNQERLHEVIRALAAMGCINYNPHAGTFEEGNHCGPDAQRLELKRRFDPKGLLNPGTMIGWDDPEYEYRLEGDYLWSKRGKTTP